MMSKKSKFLVFLTSLFLLAVQTTWAQKKAEAIPAKWADQAPVIDGQLNDWKDSLDQYNNSAKLYYSLSNDNENIYLAIKNNSRENLTAILATGISFSANIESNKKNPPKITFPIIDRTPGKKRNTTEQPEPEEIQKEILSRIKEVRVSGFKEIIDGGISLYNTYGIKAATGFDSKNNLVQEIAIPLSLLGLQSGNTEPVSYSIRINGFQGPAIRQERDMYNDMYRGRYGRNYGGMYRGMYGGMPGGSYTTRPQSTAVEFFIRSPLAVKN